MDNQCPKDVIYAGANYRPRRNLKARISIRAMLHFVGPVGMRGELS